MVDFLVGAFTEVGLQDVRGYETPDGSQAVCGHKPGPPGSPTVLLYFHHDVQPPLDESAWETPVWALTEKNGRWYGRGAADCKGNIAMHLTALRALGDDVPVTIKIVGEGSEEQGTGGLEAFVPLHPELLTRRRHPGLRRGQLRGRRAEPHHQPARPGQRLGDRSNAVQSDALGDVRRRRPGRPGCADRHAGHPARRAREHHRQRTRGAADLARGRVPARAVPQGRERPRRRGPARGARSRTWCGRGRPPPCSASTARRSSGRRPRSSRRPERGSTCASRPGWTRSTHRRL